MFDSGWLTAIGLASEILGLFFLSWDLLKSKSEEGSLAEFQSLLGQVDASSRDLVINTHKGFRSLVEFLGGYLSLLEIEAQETAKSPGTVSETPPDPGAQKVIEFIHSKGPVGIRNHAVAEFAAAKQVLLPLSEVERALQLNQSAKAELEKQFAQSVKQSARLRRLAKMGILFAAFGALLQFADLFM